MSVGRLPTSPTAPLLPPELWLQILCLATDVPGALDVNPPDPFDLPSLSGRIDCDLHRIVTHSLVTKRYVVLVCKQWYQLAIPFLYSILVLNHGRGLASLRRTLLGSKVDSESSVKDRYGLGWCTKRIDVFMHDSQTCHHDGQDTEQEYLLDILGCLPNLSIFLTCVRYRSYDASSVVRRLAAVSGPSLQRIQWCRRSYSTFYDQWHLCPDRESWQSLITSSKRLRTLEVPVCKSTCPLQLPGDSNISSLTLYYNTINIDPQCNFNIPSLTSLTFRSEEAALYKHVLSIYGRHLTTLSIYHHPEVNDMSSILPLCPNLKRFVLKLRLWCDFPENLWFSPSITSLGIEIFEIRPRVSDYFTFFIHLSTIEASGLVIVRLLSNHPQLNEYCLRYPRLEAGLQKLRLAGIVLENGHGERLAENIVQS